MKQKKMLPFPGGKVGAKRGHLTELTSAQQTWLITYFPIATNKVLFTTMGISEGLLKRFAVELNLVKDEEWSYYDRCKRIGKVEEINRVTKQTGTITIATKLSRKDYGILREAAKDNGVTKYEYLQDIIRHNLKAFSETKYPQPALF